MAMSKAKRTLSKALAAVFTAFTLLSFSPALAAPVAKPTVLTVSQQPAKEYKVGDRITFKVNSNYGGAVEYRVILWNGTTKTQKELWAGTPGYYYQNWKPSGNFEFPITWVVTEDMQPGAYSLTVLTRKAGSKASYDAFNKLNTFWVVGEEQKPPVAEATVVSVANPADVTVNVGDKFTAPTTVKATMSDKTTKDVAVTWTNSVDTSKAGDVTLTGKAADKEVSMKVSVKEVALKVDSVAAKTATTFVAKFNRAVDTSKVKFEVKRETTPYTVTATWNDAKTEATLTSSAKYPLGDYSVNVKNDTTDLGTSTVKIEQEKVAKIAITSTVLSVNNTTPQSAYFTYKVENQYGEDITNAPLANNVRFQTVFGQFTGNDGLVTFQAGQNMNLLTFNQVTITAIDNDSATLASATLNVASAVGTISDIKLGEMTNKDGKVLTAGDTITPFYVSYDAKDMSGNATKNLTILTQGLTNGVTLNTSNNNYVTAQLVQDPANSQNALIEVKAAQGSNGLQFDMPVTITAITKTGKSSNINVTLKKASQVDSFTLLSPSFDVAAGDTNKEIPFIAYDQNGKQLTKYSDLRNTVTLQGATWVENVDGTGKIVFNAPQAKGTVMVTASTPTGKFSSLTINVRDAAAPAELAVDASVVIPYMQNGAVQNMDFGKTYGGFAVKDQFGRTMDFTGAPGNYAVVPTVAQGANLNVSGYASGAKAIGVTANGLGTATVTFNLYAGTYATVNNVTTFTPAVDANNQQLPAIDSKTVTFSVVKNSDIVDYELDTINPLYANLTAAEVAGAGNNATGLDEQDKDWAANPTVYGKLSGGSRVFLSNSVAANVDANTGNNLPATIISTFVDSSDFYAWNDGSAIDETYVYAAKLDASKTGSTGKVTVLVNGTDGKVKTVTANLTSKTDAPVAQSIVASVDTTKTGVSKDGDIVNIKAANANALLNNMILTRFDANGESHSDAQHAVSKRAPIYFYAVDQYGKKAMDLQYVSIVTNGSNGHIAYANGVLTSVNAVAGDYIIVTAVTNNGLSKTVRINIVQ